MEYRIITNCAPSELEAKVLEAISEGWLPLGGLAIAEGEEFIRFGQAMIREPRQESMFTLARRGIAAKFTSPETPATAAPQ